MLTDHTIKFNKLLTPFSFLYGIGVRFRNQLFDWKILRTERYDLPIICVGNLTVGGTGKTPHTEYIIRLIKDRYRVAVLSRGYKRKPPVSCWPISEVPARISVTSRTK